MVVALACLHRPPQRRQVAGILVAFTWMLPSLLVLQIINLYFDFWKFHAVGGLIRGLPVDLSLLVDVDAVLSACKHLGDVEPRRVEWLAKTATRSSQPGAASLGTIGRDGRVGGAGVCRARPRHAHSA